MAIESNQLSVKILFEQNHTFEIPKYQRGYAWEEDAIDDFIEDISKCLRKRERSPDKPRNHFFGGVVTVRKPISNSNRSNFEVIDGQQRLASFVMLVAAIRETVQQIVHVLDEQDSLSEEDKEVQSFLEATAKTLYNTYLTYKDAILLKYEEVPKLTLSNADDGFFQSIINKQNVNAERASHERIQHAWNQLKQFVQEDVLSSATPLAKAQRLKNLIDGVLPADCTVIFMCSDERVEAYQVFQVLNDRGVHLTDGDLLRVRTMELLDQDGFESMQVRLGNLWDRVLMYSPKEINSYLRWYFASREGKRPRPSNLTDEFLEHRFEHEEHMEEIDGDIAKAIVKEVDEMDSDFLVLNTLSDGDWPYDLNDEITTWDRERVRMLVSHLKHSNAMPLLLSLRLLDAKNFAEAVASIERFVFRYKTIGNVHISRMTKLYLKHAKKIRESENYHLNSLRKDLESLVKETVPDNVFKAKLHGMQYSQRSGNAHMRYFFISLEDYADWYSDGANGVPKCKDKTRVFDFSNTTLEHVYPHKAKKKEKDLKLEEVKHTIGNLTICGPEENNKLRNKEFAEKKLILAKSNLKLNRDIAEKDKWTAYHVKRRADSLVKMALKVFVP